MPRDVYHVGDTNVYYEQTCSGDTCTTIFTAKEDGFWDPVYDIDGKGPKGEVPGGTPFGYNPFKWQETYPNPYVDQ